MTAELVALTKELHLTTQMLGRVIARLDAADQRANRHRVWTVLLAVCVAAVFLLGVWTFDLAKDSQKVIAEQEASRIEARVTACDSYNADTVDRINGIILRVADDPRAVQSLLLPYRDCTEQGIADYFDGDPATDPFVPVTIP